MLLLEETGWDNLPLPLHFLYFSYIDKLAMVKTRFLSLFFFLFNSLFLAVNQLNSANLTFSSLLFTTDINHLKLMKISLLISQEASLAVPLFSPVLVPMAQSIGPLLSQIASSPTIRLGVSIQVPTSLCILSEVLFSKQASYACISVLLLSSSLHIIGKYNISILIKYVRKENLSIITLLRYKFKCRKI